MKQCCIILLAVSIGGCGQSTDEKDERSEASVEGEIAEQIYELAGCSGRFSFACQEGYFSSIRLEYNKVSYPDGGEPKITKHSKTISGGGCRSANVILNRAVTSITRLLITNRREAYAYAKGRRGSDP